MQTSRQLVSGTKLLLIRYNLSAKFQLTAKWQINHDIFYHNLFLGNELVAGGHSEVPSIFRLTKGSIHATSFSFDC